MKSSRGSLLAWLAACAACFAIFGDAFYSWFLMDDFAWLGLKQELDAGGGWGLLFEPRAQGTVRLFSERLYFWLLTSLFGFDPLPFRIIAFAVQCLNLWLLVQVAKRLAPRESATLAGFTAAMFYACSPHMVRPLAWASSFNQIFAAAAILICFLFLLRWMETGESKFWWIQYGAFLLSFGILESVMVYPVVATLYAALFARDRLRRVLWLWPPALLFAAWHLFGVARPKGSSQYSPVFDEGVITSLGSYFWTAMGPGNGAVAGGIAALLAAGVIWRLWKHRDPLPLFFVLWFVAFIAPVLPFQNRFAGYYVVLPLTGLALCAGLLAARIPTPGALPKWIAATLLLAVYGGFSAVDAREGLQWFADRSERVHRLVDAGVEVAKARKAQALLLSGIDTDLFTLALQDTPFRLYGITRVYLVPGSESSIRARADLGGVAAYRISLPQAVELLESGSAAVLSVVGDDVHDATARYRGVALNQYLHSRPKQINVGAPGYEPLLGPGWWPIEENFRWMAQSASLKIGGPPPGDHQARLTITGFCPDTVSSKGPVTLKVSSAGHELGRKTLTETGPFTLNLNVPASANEPWVSVELAVDRITRLPGDKRDLGLIFGTFSLKP